MGSWLHQRTGRLEQEFVSRQLEVTASTSDLVATLDQDCFFLSLNLAGFHLLDINIQDTIEQKRLPDFLDLDSRKQFLALHIPNAIRFGIWQCEITILDKLQNRIPCSVALVCHRDPDQQVEYFSVIMRDIRKVKTAEEDRIHLLEQLHDAKKLETIGRIAGGIAHDFNNFITIIIGYAELALIQEGVSNELQGDLHVILDSAQKAARLTSQLLEYSSKKVIEPQILDLNRIIREAEQLVNSLLGSKISISVELDPELWHVRFDRSQLEQIIFNLAVNSRDAMSGNGCFAISTTNMPLIAAPDNLVDPLCSDYVVLTVQDSGSGIPADILGKIFDPFFTTKEKGKGTGMGLSAVKGAVKQNQSEIFVRSEPGRGSTFSIYIPAIKDFIQEFEGHDEPEALHTQCKGTILLVEDNLQVLSLVSKLLSRSGYQMITAHDGLQGLKLYQQHSNDIDLVITDIVMPGLDGYQLSKKLLGIKPDLRILMVSGHNDEIISFEQNTNPNIKLLNKPFSPERLGLAVQQLLNA